jgi:hypothetical protein
MPAPGRPGPVGLSRTQVQSDPEFKLRGPKRRARWQLPTRRDCGRSSDSDTRWRRPRARRAGPPARELHLRVRL